MSKLTHLVVPEQARYDREYDSKVGCVACGSFVEGAKMKGGNHMGFCRKVHIKRKYKTFCDEPKTSEIIL